MIAVPNQPRNDVLSAAEDLSQAQCRQKTQGILKDQKSNMICFFKIVFFLNFSKNIFVEFFRIFPKKVILRFFLSQVFQRRATCSTPNSGSNDSSSEGKKTTFDFAKLQKLSLHKSTLH